ncbi:hypothetical protein Ancab_011467 [Ancistrocladus abbreviatus]
MTVKCQQWVGEGLGEATAELQQGSSMADTDIGGNARLVVQPANMLVDEGVGLELISQSKSNLDKGSETPKSSGRENCECHQEALGTSTTRSFINEWVARHDGFESWA